MEKPKDIDEYKKWLKEMHDVEITDRTKNYYEQVATSVKEEFEKTGFWKEFDSQLREYSDQFSLQTQYTLLVNDHVELVKKPWNSFLEKTFRRNVTNNQNWPNPLDGEWILENNWFEKTKDIVRTLIVVKYIDGVEFIMKKLEELADKHNLEIGKKLEARDDGYYAAHIYINSKFEIPRKNWDTEKRKFSIEIQITTQLQEVIRKLLHKYYENKRKISNIDDAWKWDYSSNEFSAAYIGHMLHYMVL